MGKEHIFFWKLQHFQLANEEIQQKLRVNIKNIYYFEFFFFVLPHLQEKIFSLLYLYTTCSKGFEQIWGSFRVIWGHLGLFGAILGHLESFGLSNSFVLKKRYNKNNNKKATIESLH